MQRPYPLARSYRTGASSLRDYEDDDAAMGNTNVYIYTPQVVTPRVQPDSRIKEWTHPRKPSYMPDHENNHHHQHHHQQEQQQQQPSPPPRRRREPDWSHYMTVSEEVVTDPDEITKPRLTRTAPPQPSTPSPEEFLFAEIKDWVFRGGNVGKDMADPTQFDAYMTVSDPQPGPPPAFVDAEIVNDGDGDDDDDDDRNDSNDMIHGNDDGGDVVYQLPSSSSSSPPPSSATTFEDFVNNHHRDRSSPPGWTEQQQQQQQKQPSAPPHQNERTMQNDPVAMFEQNFPQSPVTMKQLAEEYRRREQHQQHYHHHQNHDENIFDDVATTMTATTSQGFFGSTPNHRRRHHHLDTTPTSSSPLGNQNQNHYYSYDDAGNSPTTTAPTATTTTGTTTPPTQRQYHIPMPYLEDLAREWASMQSTTATADYPTSPLPPSPSMEELAEAWVRMTYHGNEQQQQN